MLRAKVFRHCEAKTGIEPFNRLVDRVMATEPYASPRCVHWMVDSGSSYRGQASTDRRRADSSRRVSAGSA